MVLDLRAVVGFGVEFPAFSEDLFHTGVDPVNTGGNVRAEEGQGGLLNLEKSVAQMEVPLLGDTNVKLAKLGGVNANPVVGVLNEVEVTEGNVVVVPRGGPAKSEDLFSDSFHALASGELVHGDLEGLTLARFQLGC